MMIVKYKLKPPLVQGVEVTSVGNQAGEIAAMINAKTFNVNVADGSATFVLDDATITVKNGQVVTLMDSTVTVFDLANFLALYEPYGEL